MPYGTSRPIYKTGFANPKKFFDNNIAGMIWKGANDRKARKYNYSYDAANRLTVANFGQYVGHAFSTSPVNYTVNNLAYDYNGNITKMYQYGLKSDGSSPLIDQLAYTYSSYSNKLLKVADAAAGTATENLGDFQDGTNTGNDYAYDVNGNLTQDLNKNISAISYNYLNLPSVIRVSGKGSIYYTYDAAGNKLRKVTIDSTVLPAVKTTTLYLGSSVYQNDTLQFFGTPEGRVRADGNTWVYDYMLKDHLGNTRMVITDDYNVASPILEATSYYPFGEQMKNIDLEASGSLHNKKWTFQKQEYNDDLGVDIDEFKYRMDDPQIGRFWQIDPLADDYEYNSPYAFSEDKVTSHIELDGLEATMPIPLSPIFNPGSAHGGNGMSNSDAIREFGNDVSKAASNLITTTTVILAIGYEKIKNLIDPPKPADMKPKVLHTEGESTSQKDDSKSQQGSGEGRGKNNRKPDSEAEGDHSVINDRGSTTFHKNDKNPKGWQEGERIDTKGKPHTNSDGTVVPTPHKHIPKQKDVIPLDPKKDPMPRSN
ncbi:hypothetical protein A9P82_08555 [Arachidicoccus ginsenosidimutans]|uniref:RHS repeat domain-containing protein n=1 Tax=Arachidicoccus sp. BS20 TaxID=1850526 RepID=UPI0007F149B6|nr:RHS repeat protein [Arachidicoccus sp. BS20]ANI89338.1 hypothetical protein A9P82_08555 [Arachidicoccus sp. BS20]